MRQTRRGIHADLHIFMASLKFLSGSGYRSTATSQKEQVCFHLERKQIKNSLLLCKKGVTDRRISQTFFVLLRVYKELVCKIVWKSRHPLK